MTPAARTPIALEYRLDRSPAKDAAVVLLLHGLGSCGEDWALQRPALLPHFTVLAPDLRGQGDSPLPAGWPTIQDLAGDVLLLLDRLEIRSAHVVGLSLGGAVALQLAADEPARLRSLVAVNTFARLRATRGSRRRGIERMWLAATGRMDELGRRVADGLFPDDGQQAFRDAAAARLAGNRPLAYIKMLVAVSRFDLRARLGEIRAPTLVVAGENDTTVPLSCKLELAAHIPGARLARFAGSRHVTPLDRAGPFTARLLEFLRSVEHGAPVSTTPPQEWIE
jgi:3-oxoadipate enol-lactonase